MNSLISLLGMAVLLGIAYLFSTNRKKIRLRTVGGAFLIQFALGGIVLYLEWGRMALKWLSGMVQQVINCSQDGIEFVFGSLATNSFGFIFAFRVLPVIVFFSSLISVLYYLKIMQFVVNTLGGALRWILGTSRAESLSATANIFVGQTEAPLAVKPYLAKMTQSELFAVMCGGLASIAGSVMAGYAIMGVELKYLLAASFMAAPGGLLFAKILMPETEKASDEILQEDDAEKPVNVLDAAAGGAASGLKLALNVGAMLIAFVALIKLLNVMIGGVGSWLHFPDLSLQLLLGYIFAPLAWVLGVPWSEAMNAGNLIGQKLVLNEFVAFKALTEMVEPFTAQTQAIITFALCGFANFSSIAILLGGLGGLVPKRRHEIARFGMLAVLGGSLSNLLSAAIAGFFLGFTL